MTIVLSQPDVAELERVLHALRDWQRDGAPVQLPPGGLGWAWRFGPATTAAAVRAWSRGDRLLAVGFLDGPDLLRMAVAPEADHDEELAAVLVADLSRPERNVLPGGEVAVEVRFGAAVRASLASAGWVLDEPWTPLVRDLADPVGEVDLRVEVVGPELVEARSQVHVAAFDRSTFTPQQWRTMAAGPAYGDARCLVGFDGTGA